MNPAERAARAVKASRLARAIRALNMGLTAEDVAAFPIGCEAWLQLADLATELELRAGTLKEKERVHPPNSKATVEAVCHELRRLASEAEVAALISSPPSSGTRESRWA